MARRISLDSLTSDQTMSALLQVKPSDVPKPEWQERTKKGAKKKRGK